MFVRALVLELCWLCWVLAVPMVDNFQLVILHDNDLHARFDQVPNDPGSGYHGGFARIAHKVREYRALEAAGGSPVLYLNAGDTFTGTVWFTVYRNEIASTMMNLLQPDVMTLGNHEFDLGLEDLATFLYDVNFPVVVANVDFSDAPVLQNTSSLCKSMVLTKADVKIGIIGYLTPETKEKSSASTVTFLDEISAINEEAAALKAQGVNILLALGHSGLERDIEIAAQCPDIDIVIGGHSHTFLYSGTAPDVESPEGPYPVMVKNAAGKEVPVVQAYAYSKYLGYMQVEFDATGNLVNFQGTPILLSDSIPQSPDVLEALEVYRPGIAALDLVIGYTDVNLDAMGCPRQECNMGNMITDSMVMTNAATREDNDEGWTDAAISFIQSGGLRSGLPVGNITKKDLMSVLPFGNNVLVVEVTGSIIRSMLERSALLVDTLGFLQMSGVQVVYDLLSNSDSKVRSVMARCARCKEPTFSELVDNETYNIIINQFLYNGGDGYNMLSGLGTRKLRWRDNEITEEYVKRNRPIVAAVEKRITKWKVPR